MRCRPENNNVARQGLSKEAFAICELLDEVPADSPLSGDFRDDGTQVQSQFSQATKNMASRVEGVLDRHSSVIDWYLNQDVKRLIRRDI